MPSIRMCPTPSGRGLLTWTWVGGPALEYGRQGEEKWLPGGHLGDEMGWGEKMGSPVLHDWVLSR